MIKYIIPIIKFFFKPTTSERFAVLRIGLSLLLLFQAFELRNVVFDLFSSQAYLQQDYNQLLIENDFFIISNIAKKLALFHLTELFIIKTITSIYFICLIGLLLGWQSKLMAILVWFIHWIFLRSSASSTYGFDQFAHVFLFYFCFIPISDCWSMDSSFLKTCNTNRYSRFNKLSLRALQIHMCIAYALTGFGKITSEQWQTGDIIWRSLAVPSYKNFDLDFLIEYSLFCKILAWGTIFFELGYPMFIWPRQTRFIWLSAISSLHIGIAIFLKLYLFGIIMTLITICLFGLNFNKSSQIK